MEEALRITHSLKGVVGSVSAPELSNAVSKLDKAFREGKKKELEPLMARFKIDLTTVLESIQQLPEAEAQSQKAVELDLEVIGPILTELAEKLADDDTSALKLIEELRKNLPSDFDSKGMNSLRESVEDYEFQEALQSLENLKKQLGIGE